MTPRYALLALQSLSNIPHEPYLTPWQDALKNHPWSVPAKIGDGLDFGRGLEYLVEFRASIAGGLAWTKDGITFVVIERIGQLSIEHGRAAVTAELDRLAGLKRMHEAEMAAAWATGNENIDSIRKLTADDPDLCRILAAGHMLWAALRESSDDIEDSRGLREEAGYWLGPGYDDYMQSARDYISGGQDGPACDFVADLFTLNVAAAGRLDISRPLSDIIAQFMRDRIGSESLWSILGWQSAAKKFGMDSEI